MIVYVVLKNLKKNTLELEKFEESLWQEQRSRINQERISYVTYDIEDEQLKDFSEIIWTRVFDPMTRNYKKIVIPFNPDSIPQMENESQKSAQEYLKTQNTEVKACKERKRVKIIKSKNTEEFKSFIKTKEKNNDLIDEDLSEIDAIYKWKELNYIMPPPHKIEEVKASYNMSWSKFIKHIQDNF